MISTYLSKFSDVFCSAVLCLFKNILVHIYKIFLMFYAVLFYVYLKTYTNFMVLLYLVTRLVRITVGGLG